MLFGFDTATGRLLVNSRREQWATTYLRTTQEQVGGTELAELCGAFT